MTITKIVLNQVLKNIKIFFGGFEVPSYLLCEIILKILKKQYFSKFFFSYFQSSTIPNVTPGGAIIVTATGATTPFSTPTTVCSGAPPRQPFPNAQYGPPPGATIIPAGTVTPTPSSHGPSPTPSSGSGGGGFVNQPPGYPRSKFGRMRGNSRQPMVAPPTSPAKNRDKGILNYITLRF